MRLILSSFGLKFQAISAGPQYPVVDPFDCLDYSPDPQPKKILRKGDVIKCPPNIPHWHGASADTSFVQVAITGREKGETVWLEAVTNDEYNK